MPLYEYECANGHRFELIRKFSDPPLDACPTCQAGVRKLLSSPAIQFKGSGFYITDYARKGSGRSDGASGGETSDKGDTSDKAGKSDKADKDKSDKGEKTSDGTKSSGGTDKPAASSTSSSTPSKSE